MSSASKVMTSTAPQPNAVAHHQSGSPAGATRAPVQKEQQATSITQRHDPPFAVRAGTRPRNIIEAHVPRILAVLQRCAVVWTRETGIVVNPTTGTPVEPLSRAEVTCFHSSSVPPCSVEKYVARIAKHSTYGADGIAFGVVLLARYMVASRTVPNVFTIHRLMLACIAVGMKVNNDLFYKNKYLASVGGIPVGELNAMEYVLVDTLRYQCIVTLPELESVIEGISRAETPAAVHAVCIEAAKQCAA